MPGLQLLRDNQVSSGGQVGLFFGHQWWLGCLRGSIGACHVGGLGRVGTRTPLPTHTDWGTLVMGASSFCHTRVLSSPVGTGTGEDRFGIC